MTEASAAEVLRRICGPSVAVGRGHAGQAAVDNLFPAEAAAMTRARPARVAEFAAGRAAARQAMAVLGVAPRAVAMRPDRAPDWPAGIVGSITHDGGLCLAALARAADLGGIGIDIEPAQDLPLGLIDEITTPQERDWLADMNAASRGRMARMIFAAKEAAYKALYPLSQQVVGFDGIEVIPDSRDQGFEVTLALPFGPYRQGTILNVRCAWAEGRVIAALILPMAGN